MDRTGSPLDWSDAVTSMKTKERTNNDSDLRRLVPLKSEYSDF